MPCIVVFCVRWLTPIEESHYPLFSGENATTFGFAEVMAKAIVGYLIWQVLYYYFIIGMGLEN
jgi:hypothetical protein